MSDNFPTPADIDQDWQAGDCAILVVEDEYVVALDVCTELAARGIRVIGPAGNVALAMSLARTVGDIDGALLDVNIGGDEVFAVADVLTGRNIPFAFTTGYDPARLPERFRSVPRLEKPLLFAEVTPLLKAMCGRDKGG